MSKGKLLICLLGLAVLATSCTRERPLNTTNNLPESDLARINPVVLAFGETTILEPLDLEVTFESILHDSRCPLNVYCFWEGMAQIGLRVVELPADTHFVAVSIYGLVPQPIYDFGQCLDTLGYRFTLHSLDPYPVDPGPIPESDYTATLSIFRFTPDNSIDGEVQICDWPPAQIQIDRFGLDTAYIQANILNLTVSYSGGCFEHDFSLYMSPAAFMESYPVQANLYLRHQDPGDPCDAIIRQDLKFDLRPIAHLYEIMYESSAPIRLNMYHFYDSILGEKESLLYDPEKIWEHENRE